MNISSKARNRELELDADDNFIRPEFENENGRVRPASTETKIRHNLQFLLKATTKLDLIFENVECYGQEIPCIRSVRELSRRLKIQLGNDYGSFNRVLGELCQVQVCGISRVVTRVERLRGNVAKMVQDETCYLKYLEDVRQCLGEMNGLIETILNVEYGKR
jgi:hypothetical protein